MGKTFRKKSQETGQYDLSEKRVGNQFLPMSDKERMRKLHKEFGDQSTGKRNAPKSFRKSLTAIRKAKDGQELFKALDTEYDAVFSIHKKDANWEYW